MCWWAGAVFVTGLDFLVTVAKDDDQLSGTGSTRDLRCRLLRQ